MLSIIVLFKKKWLSENSQLCGDYLWILIKDSLFPLKRRLLLKWCLFGVIDRHQWWSFDRIYWTSSLGWIPGTIFIEVSCIVLTSHLIAQKQILSNSCLMGWFRCLEIIWIQRFKKTLLVLGYRLFGKEIFACYVFVELVQQSHQGCIWSNVMIGQVVYESLWHMFFQVLQCHR